jgi:hypothetical protein
MIRILYAYTGQFVFSKETYTGNLEMSTSDFAAYSPLKTKTTYSSTAKTCTGDDISDASLGLISF